LEKIKTRLHYFYKKPDEKYLDWVFPRNKKALIDGLIFTLITMTSITLVDYFYYAWEEIQFHIENNDIKLTFFFRLFIIPLINLGAIFLARSTWNKNMKNLEWIAGLVIFTSMAGPLWTGVVFEYYTAVEGFTYDVLPLVLFSQLLFGLTFRTSFFFNLVIVLTIFTYMTLDDSGSLIEDQIYATVLLLLIWIPVLLGALKLERSRLWNFRTISKLEETHQELSKQKKLLKAGEEVSKLVSLHIPKDLKEVSFSEGFYPIYDFEESEINNANLYEKIVGRIHPKDKEKVISEIKGLEEGRVTPASEHRILMPDGSVKWLKVTIGNYVKGEGFYSTIQDITKDKILDLELQNTARALKMKNEDLQQVAYASSHDLQEPLRTITNFVSVLDKKLKGQLSEEHKLYMDVIIRSAGRMKELINAILDYSRIGKNAKLESFDCNEVVSEVLDGLSFAIQESGGSVHLEPLPVINGYKTDFSFLLQNLIGNALKFRRDGVPPEIFVKATSNTGHFHFSVQDNGIGMEKKHIDKIFQLFSRLHAKEEYEGTGIGLTHCKKIVELHGGKIWVESVVNEGSTFHFSILKNLKTGSNEQKVGLHHVD